MGDLTPDFPASDFPGGRETWVSELGGKSQDPTHPTPDHPIQASASSAGHRCGVRRHKGRNAAAWLRRIEDRQNASAAPEGAAAAVSGDWIRRGVSAVAVSDRQAYLAPDASS